MLVGDRGKWHGSETFHQELQARLGISQGPVKTTPNVDQPRFTNRGVSLGSVGIHHFWGGRHTPYFTSMGLLISHPPNTGDTEQHHGSLAAEAKGLGWDLWCLQRVSSLTSPHPLGFSPSKERVHSSRYLVIWLVPPLSKPRARSC